MTDDRRQHPRLARPLEGRWDGARGSARCRISDISAGGCFVQSLAPPAAGEQTALAIDLPDGDVVHVTGTVVYAENQIGFSLRFDDLPPDEAGKLRRLLDPPADP